MSWSFWLGLATAALMWVAVAVLRVMTWRRMRRLAAGSGLCPSCLKCSALYRFEPSLRVCGPCGTYYALASDERRQLMREVVEMRS